MSEQPELTRGVRRWFAVVLVASSLAACAAESPGEEGSTDGVEQRLLAAADAAAEGNGGEALRVEAVLTTRGTAAELTGYGNEAQDEAVWVVQVSGDGYVCDGCSRPAGRASPTGEFLALVLRASDYEGTDFGMSPKAWDLSAFGDTEVLRDVEE